MIDHQLLPLLLLFPFYITFPIFLFPSRSSFIQCIYHPSLCLPIPSLFIFPFPSLSFPSHPLLIPSLPFSSHSLPPIPCLHRRSSSGSSTRGALCWTNHSCGAYLRSCSRAWESCTLRYVTHAHNDTDTTQSSAVLCLLLILILLLSLSLLFLS